MQAEERDLISGLFERLRPFDSQPRDPEAERLIANLVSRQPSTAYLLTQTVLVQEQALKAAQERIAELEAKAGAAAPPSGGFLASAPKIGPWGAAAAAQPQQVQQPPRSPWGAPPQPAAGGGFLRSALATAAGVAGGALLFEGIRGLLSNGSGPFSTAAAAAPLLPPDSLPSGSSAAPLSQDQFSSADLAQDDSADDDYDPGSSDDSSFDTDDT
jgi:uncharacterized protein